MKDLPRIEELLSRLHPEIARGVSSVWARPGRGEIQFFRHIIAPAGSPNVEVQLGYRRCHDFDGGDAPGQDAAGLCFNDSHLSGVIADGVAQSFFGNLAAEHVSAWLLNELWTRREDPPDEEEVTSGLQQQQKLLAEKVNSYSLEDVSIPMVRSALERTRAYGSRAVFTAFTWNLRTFSGYLYQVGNVSAILYPRRMRPIYGAGSNAQWSSTGKSQLMLSRTSMSDVLGLVISSDGVDWSWGRQGRNGLDEEAFCRMARARADNDDVSFISAFIPAHIPGIRPLRIFLCHSSQDKAAVRNLYQRLLGDGLDPWLDEEKLLPGQDWDYEIRRAVRSSDVILVCLSRSSVTREGYVQSEIRQALDEMDKKPEGVIFLIPIRLEACDVPHRLQRWQYVDFFMAGSYEKLLRALNERARTLEIAATSRDSASERQL